ncbi:MAG: response regulator [Bacteroidetes bacterium]|nr:response regulator [Bacteroidota bacterium]MCW5897309.1 response regulator [Bacteroidota bacterium]
MNLLVVDDDSVIRMLLRTMLTSEGHQVVTAADGEDALKKMNESSFDLLITDVYMPRMDGIRLRNAVRETPGKQNMPVLFISGYNDKLTTEAAKDPKREGFFKKGRPLTELIAWVKFLTTPEDKRGLAPPSVEGVPASHHQLQSDARRNVSRTARY